MAETQTTTKITPEQMALIKKLSVKSLYFFAKFVLGYDWLDVKVHLPLCKILENYEVNTKVRVTLPRSWLKSTVCSISYPIWRSIRDSNVRCLLVQNSANNARAKLRSIRGHFEGNQLFRALFPEILPTRNCRWSGDALEITRTKQFPEATFEAAGLSTRVVGRHYNLINQDDTVAPDKDEFTEDNVLPTKEDIGNAIGWHNAAIPLLVDGRFDQIIVVGTRWFEIDLLSWIGEHQPWYVSYELAVRMSEGKADPAGEAYWPERFPESYLLQLEESLGIYLFSCLYMNLPRQSNDMVFTKDMMTFFAEEPMGELVNYVTVDPAGNPKTSQAKKKRKNDYNVIMVVAKSMKTGKKYVRTYRRFRGSPGDLLQNLFEIVNTYKPRVVGIEGVAYQDSLDYFVKEEMTKRNVFFNVVMLKHGGKSKDFRILALQPIIKAGALQFKGWMKELLTELEVFPLGKTDDLADALAMQLQLWDQTAGTDEIEPEEVVDEHSFDNVLRSLAAAHRPTRTFMDVLDASDEDSANGSDPYEHLFATESKN
jgi:phage terminase large subunit-like protein